MAETTAVAPSPPLAHPSILRSKSMSDVSITSNDSKSSSITFAPLPEIAARKRRNTRPIGLASRAEMLRRSRRQYDDSMYEDHHGPPPEDDDDIPLPDIGKLVKGLWRSVSRKGKNAQSTQLSVPVDEKGELISSAIDEEDGDGEGGVWTEDVTCTASDAVVSPPLLSTSIERESNQDTMCTIDSGSFLDEYDGNKPKTHIHQPRLEEGRRLAVG